MDESKKKRMTQEDMMKLLDSCYEKALKGIPAVSAPVSGMAEDYLKKYNDPQKAAKAMLKNQVLKCTTSGFITGFGGFLVMPVTVPANLASVLYVQIRMIGCVAYMAGFDLSADQTQTFVYACLAGVSMNALVKQVGVKCGMKLAQGLIKRIPGRILIAINKKVGFRLFTKFGTKGLVNLGKLIPGVGAVISGGLDYAETKVIAARAYRWFFEGDFSKEAKDKTDGQEPEFVAADFEEQPAEAASDSTR